MSGDIAVANIIALIVLTALIAIPVVAAVRVYRDALPGYGRRVARALAFDPRHPGLQYNLRDD
jgi:hypothetical protein